MKHREWIAGQRYSMNNAYFEAFHNYTSKSLDIHIHSHDFFETLLFVKGDVNFCVEDKIYQMHPGDILLTNSRELHKASVKGGNIYERYVVWFHPDFVEQISEFTGINAAKSFSSSIEKHDNLIRPDSYQFEKMVSKIRELPLNNETAMNPVTPIHRLTAAQILIMMNELYNSDSSHSAADVISNPKINDIVLYINHNLSDDLSLDTLSKKFHISK